jgi:hypothetical protein
MMQAAACHLVRARPTSHRESLVPGRLRARSRRPDKWTLFLANTGSSSPDNCERQFNKED